MDKYYTRIEQSVRLLNLGLNPESADMFYNEETDETCPKDIVDTKYPMVIREGQKHYLEEYGIPCWSLGALLDIMPDEPLIFHKNNNYTIIDMMDFNSGIVRNKHREKGHTPLEAAFNMVVWLLENNCINRLKNG